MRIMKIVREEEVCSVCDGTGTAVSFTVDGEKEPVPCLCRFKHLNKGDGYEYGNEMEETDS
jgi:hypothetical protein